MVRSIHAPSSSLSALGDMTSSVPCACSLSLCLCIALVGPELNIAVFSETASLDQLALLAHQVLHRDIPITENTQVVADDMTVAAVGARDEHRAAVVALL